MFSAFGDVFIVSHFGSVLSPPFTLIWLFLSWLYDIFFIWLYDIVSKGLPAAKLQISSYIQSGELASLVAVISLQPFQNPQVLTAE